jgi:hypothetical protein
MEGGIFSSRRQCNKSVRNIGVCVRECMEIRVLRNFLASCWFSLPSLIHFLNEFSCPLLYSPVSSSFCRVCVCVWGLTFKSGYLILIKSDMCKIMVFQNLNCVFANSWRFRYFLAPSTCQIFSNIKKQLKVKKLSKHAMSAPSTLSLLNSIEFSSFSFFYLIGNGGKR